MFLGRQNNRDSSKNSSSLCVFSGSQNEFSKRKGAALSSSRSPNQPKKNKQNISTVNSHNSAQNSPSSKVRHNNSTDIFNIATSSNNLLLPNSSTWKAGKESHNSQRRKKITINVAPPSKKKDVMG